MCTLYRTKIHSGPLFYGHFEINTETNVPKVLGETEVSTVLYVPFDTVEP